MPADLPSEEELRELETWAAKVLRYPAEHGDCECYRCALTTRRREHFRALIASARAARRVEAVLAELADDEGLTRREAAILAALTATAEPTAGEER